MRPPACFPTQFCLFSTFQQKGWLMFGRTDASKNSKAFHFQRVMSSCKSVTFAFALSHSCNWKKPLQIYRSQWATEVFAIRYSLFAYSRIVKKYYSCKNSWMVVFANIRVFVYSFLALDKIPQNTWAFTLWRHFNCLVCTTSKISHVKKKG